jgi:hypothetical protein
MNDDIKGFEEGVTQGPVAEYVSVTKPMPLSPEMSLLGLSEEFVFYSPAMLMSAMPEGPDLFASYLAETGCGAEQFEMDFGRALFQGVLTHANVLWCIRKHEWQPFRDYLGTAAMKVQDKIVRIRLQDLEIPDPILQEKHPLSEPVMVPVVALALEATTGSMFYRRYWSNGQLVGIRCVVDPQHVFADTQAFAAAFNAEAPDPYKEANNESEDRTTRPE